MGKTMDDKLGRVQRARGYFGIGIVYGKKECNVGTLWRSAYQLGASFIFTVGQRYKHQASDTSKTYLHVPLYAYETWESFQELSPYGCQYVAVEMTPVAAPLYRLVHPERAVYLLGAEDRGLPDSVLEQCPYHVQIETDRMTSFNVAVAGSIVMYDRLIKNIR